MDEITITHTPTPSGGEYVAHVPGTQTIGRLTWTVTPGRPDVRIADHTLVPPAIGNRGIAARLVEALVADARREGFRISPACSYVAAAFRRHPEWADVKA